jgi:hypothetical protein
VKKYQGNQLVLKPDGLILFSVAKKVCKNAWHNNASPRLPSHPRCCAGPAHQLFLVGIGQTDVDAEIGWVEKQVPRMAWRKAGQVRRRARVLMRREWAPLRSIRGALFFCNFSFGQAKEKLELNAGGNDKPGRVPQLHFL